MTRAGHLSRAVLAATALSSAASCSEDVDYVRVVVRGTDPALTVSTLELRVALAGGGNGSSFKYDASAKSAKPGEPPPDLSDFTVSFGAGAGGEVDVRLATRPSGQAFDWGGDARVELPGGGRTVTITLAPGEDERLPAINPLDGDVASAASYAGQIVLAWPTLSRKVSLLSVNPDRLPGFERPPEYGTNPSKLRVASRPSSDFPSEIFAAVWLDQASVPTIKTETRTQAFEPVAIGTLTRASDVHVACARRELEQTSPSVATAVLIEGRVLVHTHADSGATTRGPLGNPALDRVNRIVGIAVTPDDTVTLAINGNGSSLVQMDAATGNIVQAAPVSGQAVAMSFSADGSRLLVASVAGVGEQATLQLETFSVRKPTPTQAAALVVSRFSYVPGTAFSRVSLGSCGIAWPELRADGSGLTDVRFQQLDSDGHPVGDAHFANVSTKDHHYAPTLVCLSPRRAFLTMIGGDGSANANARLLLRRLPMTQ
jgi:hypothetical protein